MRRAGLAVLTCCLVFATTGSLPSAAAELLHSAGPWGLPYELAPASRIGAYQAVWSMGTQLGRSCGPFVIALALTERGAAGWIALGIGYAAVSALVVPLARRSRVAAVAHDAAPASIPTSTFASASTPAARHRPGSDTKVLPEYEDGPSLSLLLPGPARPAGSA
ncbi:hypothetical protein [Streptomyces sp. Wb2n-11]|uniref:hypothetical protein n=1 Tax=Streptomyces sp. Wb2n-11 TaxID=1030533 RepID=UPI000AB7CEC3|nr:hypothetical protein [Streptomyces sp. Wb2n-11]